MKNPWHSALAPTYDFLLVTVSAYVIFLPAGGHVPWTDRTGAMTGLPPGSASVIIRSTIRGCKTQLYQNVLHAMSSIRSVSGIKLRGALCQIGVAVIAYHCKLYQRRAV